MIRKGGTRILVLSRKGRLILAFTFILLIVLMILGAASIPFLFESSSIKYKFGVDKTFLRIGKILGLIAGVLLLLQMPMSSRFKILDRVFSLNRLLSIHRINGIIIAVLTLFHPLFVYAPEDIGAVQLSIDSWPEILGGLLLLLIWLLVSSGIWRQFLDLSFHSWWFMHRIGTFVVLTALFLHVLFVSDTFHSGLPHYIVFAFIGLYLFFWGGMKLKHFMRKLKSYTVTKVFEAGKDAYAVILDQRKGEVFDYIPGQFAFLSFISGELSREEHPFTISSTPTRPSNLHITIRCSGDWTGLIGRLRPGDKAVINGPYGLFSQLVNSRYRELIMIAGGIGITPMLSMLRYMVDEGEERPVTLIWSNRTRGDVVYPSEFVEFEKRLNGFRLFHVFTREPSVRGEKDRLGETSLKVFLKDCSRESGVFLCGPPKMMYDTRRALLALGFPARTIHTENFRL